MKKIKSTILFIALLSVTLLIIIPSCSDVEVNCTEEFRTVIITVTGDSLTDHYTFREKTLDTIKIGRDYIFPGYEGYPVLNDTYQPMIQNSRENFRFVGEINDTVVVNEEFVIEADQCHIEKISGKVQVDL